MLNGRDLIDRIKWSSKYDCRARKVDLSDFDAIQYMIPVIRKLKLDVTADVVNAYVNCFNGNGSYYNGEMGCMGEFCYCDPVYPEGIRDTFSDYEYKKCISKYHDAHGYIIPPELECMAHRYAMSYLPKLFDTIGRIQMNMLDSAHRTIGEGLRVPVKFNNGIKKLSELLTEDSRRSSYKDPCYYQEFAMKLNDVKLNIFPDVAEREWYNTAFARWLPNGNDVVTSAENRLSSPNGYLGSGRYCDRDRCRSLSIRNSVRVDSNAAEIVRSLIYRLYPGNPEQVDTCKFDMLADAMEIVQYAACVLNQCCGCDRLIDRESAILADKYRMTGDDMNLDESFYKLSPLAAILTAKTLSSSLYAENGGSNDPRRYVIKLWRYFRPGNTVLNAPDTDIAMFIDTELVRQRRMADKFIDENRNQIEDKQCRREECR